MAAPLFTAPGCFCLASKCTHISFKSKFTSTYNLSDTAISSYNFQKDLSLIVSNNLSWVNHYNHIICCAYKILGLMHRLFSPSLNPSVKMKLYLTLVHSQLMYCTPIWHLYLLKRYKKYGENSTKMTVIVITKLGFLHSSSCL